VCRRDSKGRGRGEGKGKGRRTKRRVREEEGKEYRKEGKGRGLTGHTLGQVFGHRLHFLLGVGARGDIQEYSLPFSGQVGVPSGSGRPNQELIYKRIKKKKNLGGKPILPFARKSG
jgi:hypothetical protein